MRRKLMLALSLIYLLLGILQVSWVTAYVQIPQGCVRIHYIRPDQTYDNWTLYVWGEGFSGTEVTWDRSIPITEIDDYSCYWDIPSSRNGSLNFIIHNGSTKELITDRLLEDTSTATEFYVVSGNPTIFTDLVTSLQDARITYLNLPAIPNNCVRLHYGRSDNTYTDWGLHVWGAGYNGRSVDWNQPLTCTGTDTYGVYWDIPADRSAELGFIIHQGNTKDPGINQFFKLTADENWVYSGETTVFTSRLDAVRAGSNRILQATIIGLNEIEIRTRLPLNAHFALYDAQQEISITSIDTSNAPTYRITVSQKLDLTKPYTVTNGQLSAFTVVAPELIDAIFAYNNWLGNRYTPKSTSFRLWAPLASAVQLYLYSAGSSRFPERIIALSPLKQGVWTTTVFGDLDGKFYQYAVINQGTTHLVLDPYARSMAAFNSDGSDSVGKGAIVDLQRSNPPNWKRDAFIPLKDQEDAILYEISVRDFTITENSGVPRRLKGTYLGFIQKIPYLKRLGITHVQLMPVQNWYYGNESNRNYEKTHASPANYNWGYDPHQYNSPEGWYSTSPDNPYSRIRELKQLIAALHRAGIGVVLDVVYNHTATTAILEDIVPNYYYRRDQNGILTNGSGCNNDTASERAMWRKFMIESTTYWLKEYHVDGFRFDLAALHDDATMQQIAAACRAINPNVELHCEGWDLGTLPPNERYTKGCGDVADFKRSCLVMPHAVGMFSDGIRDGILQTSYQNLAEGTFIQAQQNDEAKIRAGVIGNLAEYSTPMAIETAKYHRFCDDPEEAVNYTNCHDGLTLWDKLKVTLPNASEAEWLGANQLAIAIILTSQGKAFFQGGEELCRSKPDPDNENGFGFSSNTHDQGDLCNQFDWSQIKTKRRLLEYYRGLITLRKQHEAFRMETAQEVQKGVTFIDESIDFLLAFQLEEQDGQDPWKQIMVIYNANRTSQTLNLPQIDSTWKVVVDGVHAGVTPLRHSKVVIGKGFLTVPPLSAIVIYHESRS